MCFKFIDIITLNGRQIDQHSAWIWLFEHLYQRGYWNAQKSTVLQWLFKSLKRFLNTLVIATFMSAFLVKHFRFGRTNVVFILYAMLHFRNYRSTALSSGCSLIFFNTSFKGSKQTAHIVGLEMRIWMPDPDFYAFIIEAAFSTDQNLQFTPVVFGNHFFGSDFIHLDLPSF